jgi:hypothetical protein
MTGFTPPPTGEIDSLAAELALLAALCADEAGVRETGDQTAVSRLLQIQSHFLTEHLLRWLPLLCEALERETPFYAAYGALLAEFAADHAAALRREPPAWRPPAPMDLLDNPATRLDDITRHLLRPARAGFLLERRTLRDVARATSLPVSLGDRRFMLTSLLQAAGEYDAAPDLLRALKARAERACAFYANLAAHLPPIAPWVTPWQEQAAATGRFLEEMRAALP